MRQLIKALVDDAALKSWGFLSVLPEEDPKAKNRINCISIHDPFDVFFDNQDMEKARVVVISSLEDKQFLISQGYDEAKVVLSSEGTSVSHSILKSTFELNQGTDQNDKKLGKLLVDHVYYIDDGQKGKPTVKYFVISGGTLLKEEETLKGYRSLSQIFFPYYLEYDPHVKYPTPWMTDAVALQRSLNDASENADTIAHWTAKVRFMQRAGSSNTLQLIGDRHVQKIRYSGDKPQFMEMPAVPPSLFNLIGVREAQIEDAVGMHSASMGRIEGDRQSGRLTALAQAGDMDNVSEPVSNLEVFLAKVFAQILENAADNTREAMEIYGDNQEKFMVISEDLIGEATEGAVAIKRFKNVKVTVVPGNMQQLAQGRQEILNLFPVLAGENFEEERKALFKVLMRMYAVGTSRDIAKALEREQEEEERRNADVKIAELEVEKMAQGMPVTATPEQPHEIHVQLKTLALKNIVGQVGKDSDVFQIFMNNIMQHQSFLEGTKPTTIADAFSGGAV